jgi:GNAT superfamily N-acetyltransferase
MSILNSVIKVRQMRDSDKPFIYSSFLKGLYYDNDHFNKMQKDEFMLHYKAIVESLLTTGNTKVACLGDDENILVGYAVYNHNDEALHWVYVKKDWRNQGIGVYLLEPLPKYFTHYSKAGLLLKDKIPNITFNPFILL